VALNVVLALQVAVLTPPWEASDEPDHVRNVETLVDGHMYRIRAGGGVEPHQPPLYYAGLAAWQRLFSVPAFRPSPEVGCDFLVQQCGWLFRHDVPDDGADQRRVTLLRLPGVVLGALTVWLTALAARRVSRDPWTPVVAAAVVAVTPRFVFLSGVVSNDNLANTLAAAATALAVAAIALPADATRQQKLAAIALGLVFGAIILTKSTAIALAPGIALALYLAGPNRRHGLVLARVACVVAIVVSGPWLLFNTFTYGDPLAIGAARDYLAAISTLPGHGPLIFAVDPPVETLFVTMPKEFYAGWWYESGWTAFEWPWWAYLPFWLVTLGAVAGFFVRPKRTVAGPPAALQRRAVVVLAALLLVPVATVWLLRLETHTAEARLALVGLPAFACLMAIGLERHRLPVAARFALPLLGAVGTLIAINHDVADTSAKQPSRAATGPHIAQVLTSADDGRHR
jgi:4-amino-4-deoxy-L-arabinose transferase-like glycosyltransferase